MAIEKREDPVGYLVERQVFADVSLGSFPHEKAFGGI